MQLFQKFDLEEVLADSLPDSAIKLIKELNALGYVVLESSYSIGGFPKSIVIGGEGCSHKLDFFNLAESLGLSYRSGDFYFNSVDRRPELKLSSNYN